MNLSLLLTYFKTSLLADPHALTCSHAQHFETFLDSTSVHVLSFRYFIDYSPPPFLTTQCLIDLRYGLEELNCHRPSSIYMYVVRSCGHSLHDAQPEFPLHGQPMIALVHVCRRPRQSFARCPSRNLPLTASPWHSLIWLSVLSQSTISS